jgi:NADPH:quinone reductase-like Zn-dependent oxidoreductase
MRQVFIARKGPPARALEVRETPDPRPRAGEVRIRVRAAGVNFADLMACHGLYPDAPPRPFVPGYEVAGEIDEVGEGVPQSRRGERVVALTRFGGYSELIAARPDLILPVPAGLSFAEAASIPVNWLTAWHMLVELSNLRPGQRVLVHAAAGGVGLAALQICKRIGAEVIGTASAGKHARLREFGLSHAIDYRTQDFETEIRRITAGKGVHVALDAVGGASIQKSFRSLAPTGKLMIFGASSVLGGFRKMIGSALRMAPFWPLSLMKTNKAIFGVNIGRLWTEADMLVREMRDILRGFEEGAFKAVVDAEVPFAQAPRALERLEHRQNFGKVVLVP